MDIGTNADDIDNLEARVSDNEADIADLVSRRVTRDFFRTNKTDITFSTTYDVLDFTVMAGETVNLSAHANVLDSINTGGGTGISMSLTKTDTKVTAMEVARSSTIVDYAKAKKTESNIIYRAAVNENTDYHL
jgi:2-polyprenyl-3-methyl-5-hydroxy-6-metoxy-1,4-benzoquinol methylase